VGDAVRRLAKTCARAVLRSYRLVRIYEVDLRTKQPPHPLTQTSVDFRMLTR